MGALVVAAVARLRVVAAVGAARVPRLPVYSGRLASTPVNSLKPLATSRALPPT